MRLAREEVDVSDLLEQVTTPTLVLHAQDDAAVPFEQGRNLASAIPDARFVPLDGRNHILLADEPAWGHLPPGAQQVPAEVAERR